MIDSVVKDYSIQLKKLGIDHQILEHPHLTSVADVQTYLKMKVSDACPTLIMKADDRFVAIVKRGDARLDSNKIRQVLKVSSLRLATKDEFVGVTGQPLGAARVLNPGLLTLLDKHLFDQEFLNGGTGSFEVTFRYRTADLPKIPGSQILDLVETTIEKVNGVKRILSGITPSGDELHLGNYFGAVKPQIELQNQDQYETYYFVADLHALTTIKDRDQLERNITGVVLDYLSLGLDPNKAVFFRQSEVPEHSKLAVVLANFVSFGQMKRMHAFKDKLEKGISRDAINMGLFNYPILMAADILLYKPYGVPVGEDQRQHVELTRDIADVFNRTYGKNTFPLPVPMIREDVGKIIGTDGTRKMSKSLGNIISIFRDEPTIKKQIMESYTDPNRIHATDPGTIIGNPIFVYHDLVNQNAEEVADLKQRYQNGQVGDIEVKEKLFQAHLNYFALARQKHRELEANPELVKDILAKGAKKARKFAGATLKEVYQTIGIQNQLNQTGD